LQRKYELDEIDLRVVSLAVYRSGFLRMPTQPGLYVSVSGPVHAVLNRSQNKHAGS
jgi:hypothetical protein